MKFDRNNIEAVSLSKVALPVEKFVHCVDGSVVMESEPVDLQ